MSNQTYTLGFIGIGLMGQPMTLRLLDAGYSVNVWNRSLEKLHTVIDAGATAQASIADLVRVSDVILLCLSDTHAVETIVREQIAPFGSARKLLIALSSIYPDTTRQLAGLLYEQHGMGWVDAPVSGGVSGAERGMLAIMAGGNKEHIAIARG
ncbi:MAG: hypothetical protein EXR80_10110 [Methylococcales bacterium]|nr:hypothetical protein [Methylococcales bacterium]